MRIIHLSDMHFGTETQSVLLALEEALKTISADLIVITGDFTQRALHRQYRAAQRFLAIFQHQNVIYVPGNHDISLHNPFERFFHTFKKFQHYLSEGLNPCYQDDTVALLGVNSVTPYRAKDGFISEAQLESIKTYFGTIPENKIRIVAMHHNLIASEKHRIILNAETLLETLTQVNVKLVLSGHLHYACVEEIQRDFIHYPLYIVTAGTATSRRTRSQQNSFNVVEVNNNEFTLWVHEYRDGEFSVLTETPFEFN